MQLPKFKIPIILIILLLFLINAVSAQSVLSDNNGDGGVSIISIGDSLTYGVGSQFEVSAVVRDVSVAGAKFGYPKVLETALGVPFFNRGVPGESFVGAGDARVTRALQEATDVVILLEGSNDAIFQVAPSTYRNRLQRVANHANKNNQRIIFVTIPEPCCGHGGQELFVSAYNRAIRDIANANLIRVADVDLAFRRACINPFECELLNLPEGLHPNKEGHNLMAYVIAASLLDIDIFSSGGNSSVEQVLGLPEGSVPDLSL